MDVLMAVGLALLLTHEVDAGHHHEWRLLVWLRHLPDDRAQVWFTALHLPLFVVLLLVLPDASDTVLLVIDVFLVVHAGLHHRLRSHPRNDLTSPFSLGVVHAAGAVGLAHGVLLLASQ